MTQSAIGPPLENQTGPSSGRFSFGALALVLAVRLVLEILHLHQPIFEGYVGRQIPTAMVARNLATGGHFFYPRLQTGPFPSYFLVEPPIYACIAAILHKINALPLDASGRIVSLAGLSLTAIATFQICRKHWGLQSAQWATATLLAMPVALRYGRAFQPDMLALGLIFFALAMEDQSDDKKPFYRRFHFLFYMLALATKVTLAPLLITRLAFYKESAKGPNRKSIIKWALESSLILTPALGWYAWCLWLKSGHAAAGQSADGLAYWLKMIGPLALFSKESIKTIWPNLAWKSWTPLCFMLVPTALFYFHKSRFLQYHLFSTACWLLLVGAKAHHAYYWLVPTPAIAICAGLWINSPQAKPVRQCLLLALIATGLLQSRATWKTPPEWQPLTTDLQAIRSILNSDPARHLIAHEAAVYAVNRPGLRWEWSPLAQQRAASAWGTGGLSGDPPAALLEFYLNHGGRWFLAIETDPEWPSGRPSLSPHLPHLQVVYNKAGLILYDLKSSEPRAGQP